LALQVSKVLQTTAKSGNQLSGRCDIVSMAIYGGVEKNAQINTMLGEDKSSCTFLLITATPMRLIDILGLTGSGRKHESSEHPPNQQQSPQPHPQLQQQIILRNLFLTTHFFVIDEADRMATQMDISQQVGLIVDFLKQKSTCLSHQCLFSATLPEKALSVCHSWIPFPCVMYSK
jgi:superfamily II DNA/RNA helicase